MKYKRSIFPVLGLAAALSACGGSSGRETVRDGSEVKEAEASSSVSVVNSGSDTAEEDSDRYPIRTADGQTLKYDYTTVDGLKLDAGAKIGVIVKDQQNSYWNAVREGAEQAVRELNESLGYEGKDKITLVFEAPKESNDVDSQVNLVDGILSENPAAVCVAAVDDDSLTAQVEAARDNDIPMVILDSGFENDSAAASCRTDNSKAAALAAQKMCEYLSEKGEIAIFQENADSESSKTRLGGIREEIKKHPGVQEKVVLGGEDPDGKASAEDRIREMLESYPDLKGILCTSEKAGTEVLSVLKNLNRGDIAVVGMDSGKTQLKAVEDGTEYGIVSQDPRSMGYVAVAAAVRAASGLETDPEIYTEYVWINKVNLESGEYENYLYE